MLLDEGARDLTGLLGSAGPVPDGRRPAVLRELAAVWDSLAGAHQYAMAARKLPRAEALKWRPPVLEFDLERHPEPGAAAARLPVQHWAVDLAAGTATVTRWSTRPSVKAALQWDARPALRELGDKLRTGAADPRLRWSDDRDTVAPVLRQILPPGAIGAVRQAQERNFWAAWRSLMRALEWEPHPSPVMTNCFLRPERDIELERNRILIEEWDAWYQDAAARQPELEPDAPREFEAVIRALGTRFPGVRAVPSAVPLPEGEEGFFVLEPGQNFDNARFFRQTEAGRWLGYAEGLYRWSPDAEPAPHAWNVDPATGEVVEVTYGPAQAAADKNSHPEYVGVQINMAIATRTLRGLRIPLRNGSVLTALLSTGQMIDGVYRLPYYPGVIAGITRADWGKAVTEVTKALAVWAASKGCDDMTRLKHDPPRQRSQGRKKKRR